MKRFFLFLLFACFSGSVFASSSEMFLSIVSFGQTILEAFVKLYFVFMVALVVYAFIKISRELLFLDAAKGVRIVSPAESRELERKYRESLAKEEGTGATTNQKEFSLDFHC